MNVSTWHNATNYYRLRIKASKGYVFTGMCHSSYSTGGWEVDNTKGQPTLPPARVRSQPPTPLTRVRDQPPTPWSGSEVNHLPPGQGQRSTTLPWPGSEVNHLLLARVRGQPPPSPGQDTHPLPPISRHYVQAGGMHRTGMHSSCTNSSRLKHRSYELTLTATVVRLNTLIDIHAINLEMKSLSLVHYMYLNSPTDSNITHFFYLLKLQSQFHYVNES